MRSQLTIRKPSPSTTTSNRGRVVLVENFRDLVGEWRAHRRKTGDSVNATVHVRPGRLLKALRVLLAGPPKGAPGDVSHRDAERTTLAQVPHPAELVIAHPPGPCFGGCHKRDMAPVAEKTTSEPHLPPCALLTSNEPNPGTSQTRLTIDPAILETILERAMSAARLVGYIDEPAVDTFVELLADDIDEIVHIVTELLGNPHLIAAPVPSARSTFAPDVVTFTGSRVVAADDRVVPDGAPLLNAGTGDAR
jgi:hypothetical protein